MTDDPLEAPHKGRGQLGAFVASYRIYRLDTGGRLTLGETFDAASDGDAVVRAQAMHRHGVAAELWSGGRMVGRFSKLGVFTRGPG